MLKALGVCLVVLACAALGFEKSLRLTKRLEHLREMQKMALFLKGEISYRKSALPEALERTAGKLGEPFASFLRETSRRADAYEGTAFAEIFAQEAETAFAGGVLTLEDRQELIQLGQCLGYLDIAMQENSIALFLQELDLKVQVMQTETPVKKKLYQSMGVLGGIFLAVAFL